MVAIPPTDIRLVFKIIIHALLAGALLRNCLLFPVHLSNRSCRSSLVRLLIVTRLDEPRETERHALASTGGSDELICCSLVSWTESQIGCFNFPYQSGLKPHVWLILGNARMRVEGLGPVNGKRRELLVELFENGF